MNPIKINNLNNGIKVISRKNTNTPRISLNLFMRSGSKYEALAGTSNLTGRLLLQGTKTRTAEVLANELDSEAIEISVETKQDYLRVRALFLNEDLEKTLELFEDIVKNSTFDNIEKEIKKLEGEILLDLDSPKTQAFDNLIKNIYPNHPYGYTNSKILEDIKKIKKEDIDNFYFNKTFVTEKMTFSIVGDFDENYILSLLNDKFGDLSNNYKPDKSLNINEIKENKTVTVARKDSAQAQIIQGWLAPPVTHDDYASVTLMNTILGASGLSSRLFVELRDKKGLAYTVRSSYEPLQESGLFSIYIGTAPANIKTCIDGFAEEVKKLQTELISEEELLGAKNNFLGKREFFHETNSQQAYYLGFYDAMGLGAEYDNIIAEKIKEISPEQIKAAANKYLDRNSIISIVAPAEYL